MIYLINNFLVYAIRFAIMLGVIVGGSFLGSTLRKRKDSKAM
ncbi:MAG: hypothetical protein Q4F05_03800 [bacterium]|nr:hypothetical protein [bacterium]